MGVVSLILWGKLDAVLYGTDHRTSRTLHFTLVKQIVKTPSELWLAIITLQEDSRANKIVSGVATIILHGQLGPVQIVPIHFVFRILLSSN